jgi:hypothetical protein
MKRIDSGLPGVNARLIPALTTGSHKMNFGAVMYTTGLRGYAVRQLVAHVT